MNGASFSASATIIGLLFVALGVVFLLDALDLWRARLDVLLPVFVIALGAALIVSAMRRRTP
jgi:hypothetical protein